MKNREQKYLFVKKQLQRKLAKMRKLCYSLAMQASFPDSCYFYNQKERELERLISELKPKFSPKKWDKMWFFIEREADRIYFNYNIKTYNGYTAYDMDSAMCNC